MYKKLVSTLYLLNIVFQAFYTLALPIGIGVLASFLLTEYASAPKWIWALLLILGVFTGLYSMIKYILTATKNLDRLEAEKVKKAKEAKEKEEKQAALRRENIGDNNERN